MTTMTRSLAPLPRICPPDLPAPNKATGILRLTGCWPELLRDLARLDRVWIETAIPGLDMAQAALLQGIRIEQNIAQATGRRFALHLFLDQWHVLRTLPDGEIEDPQQLRIEDQSRTTLLTLSLDHRSNGFALRTLLRNHQAERQRVVPLHRRTDRVATASNYAAFIRVLNQHSQVGVDDPDSLDIGEVCGWQRLSPERLREQGQIQPVDPEQIACFLGALADQALPVRVLTGTAGVAHRFDGAFYFHQRRAGSWLQLLGDDVRLRIETAAIDSAWVFRRQGASGQRRQLRLYDASGRALAVIENLPGFDQAENPIWRTLINTLLD